VLRGRLEDFRLTDICRLIANARETGTMYVEGPLGEGAIYFTSGHVCHARSSRVTNGFGRTLVDRGALSADDLLRSVEICTVTGESLEQALVTYGFVVPDELRSAVLDQLEQVALDLFSFPSGRFEFASGIELPTTYPVAVPVDALIERAERAVSVRRLGSRVPVRTDAILLDPESPTDALLLSLVDGRTTIKDIAASLGVDILDALRSFYRLLTAGLVDVAPSSTVIDLSERRASLSG
jgi:Domain of unknown function (DUF4388)